VPISPTIVDPYVTDEYGNPVGEVTTAHSDLEMALLILLTAYILARDDASSGLKVPFPRHKVSRKITEISQRIDTLVRIDFKAVTARAVAEAVRDGGLVKGATTAPDTTALTKSLQSLYPTVLSRTETMDPAKGLTGFVDTLGRNWSLGAYVEALTRGAYLDEALKSYVSCFEPDSLFIVSINKSPHFECFQWEGKILSIFPDERADATIADSRENGLWHNHCQHKMYPYKPGMDVPQFSGDPNRSLKRSTGRARRATVRKDVIKRGVRDIG